MSHMDCLFYILTRGISYLNVHLCHNDHVDPFSLQLHSASLFVSVNDIHLFL